MSFAAMHKGINQYQQVGAAGAAFADPHRLIEMLLDGGVDRLAQARGAVHRGDRQAKIKLIGKAFDIIGGLRGGLDLNKGGEVAANLDNLYDYMQRRLVTANARDDASIIDEVLSLLTEIREAWKAIPPEVRKDPSAHVGSSEAAVNVVE
ncbi:flagellar export chaperone FliS [Ectothiorhodospira marina]|uniref:Flagellar secretion chaperone FliS n=1 Tax=Ectothiorhodospira marina TaxID=1396821 RepID=A0A1H7R4L6_9GAMM|nr:flagellar export chaperone FliS [Ectothiorhodospira marina]SEL55079.1 flagellar protein FliS [Ectothiorhodospira marina]